MNSKWDDPYQESSHVGDWPVVCASCRSSRTFPQPPLISPVDNSEDTCTTRTVVGRYRSGTIAGTNSRARASGPGRFLAQPSFPLHAERERSETVRVVHPFCQGVQAAFACSIHTLVLPRTQPASSRSSPINTIQRSPFSIASDSFRGEVWAVVPFAPTPTGAGICASQVLTPLAQMNSSLAYGR